MLANFQQVVFHLVLTRQHSKEIHITGFWPLNQCVQTKIMQTNNLLIPKTILYFQLTFRDFGGATLRRFYLPPKNFIDLFRLMAIPYSWVACLRFKPGS